MSACACGSTRRRVTPTSSKDLQMAKRIGAAGDKLYLDIHYSDFWVDPQHQDIPADWAGARPAADGKATVEKLHART